MAVQPFVLVRACDARIRPRRGCAWVVGLIPILPILPILISALIIAPDALATTAPAAGASGKRPTEIRRKGEPIRWTLEDGREFGLSRAGLPPMVFSIPFEVGEQTCERPTPQRPRCEFRFGLQVERFDLRWTKNPTPGREGELVKIKTPNGDFEAGEINLFGPYHRYVHERIFPVLQRVQIVCDDFTWLTGTQTAPAGFTLTSLSEERMMPNPETGANENTTLDGAFDLNFERRDDHRLEAIAIGSFFAAQASLSQFIFINGADVMHVVNQTPDGGVCQIALKPDFTKAFKEVQEYFARLPKVGQVYIDGQDEVWDLVRKRALGFLASILDSTEGDEFE